MCHRGALLSSVRVAAWMCLLGPITVVDWTLQESPTENEQFRDGYHQVFNICRTKFLYLKDSHTVVRLSLPNPLKPDVKSEMKM